MIRARRTPKGRTASNTKNIVDRRRCRNRNRNKGIIIMHQLRQNTKINNMAIPKSSKMQMHTNKNCTEK